MNYNNYFPASYQPIYPQQYQYQQQLQMQQAQQQAQAQQQVPQQQFTPPTIHAEIVQIASREEGVNYPVGAGQTQMMIMKDDSAILIKTAFPNGQINIEEYIRKPKSTSPDAEGYVTREEFEQRLSELTAKRNAVQRKEKTE